MLCIVVKKWNSNMITLMKQWSTTLKFVFQQPKKIIFFKIKRLFCLNLNENYFYVVDNDDQLYTCELHIQSELC